MEKIFLSLVTVLSAAMFGSLAQAQVTQPAMAGQILWEQANGSAMGQCAGTSSFNFCYYNLQQRADQDAGMRAKDECFLHGGQVYGIPNCNVNSFCNPNYLPSNAPLQIVTCYSTCMVQCQFR